MSRGRRKPGYALLLVLVHQTIMLSIWGLANRQTGTLLKLETVLDQRMLRNTGSLVLTGRGVALLETGTPHDSADNDLAPCLCRALAGDNQWYVIAFTRMVEDPQEWMVAVRLWSAFSDPPLADIPLLPDTFQNPIPGT